MQEKGREREPERRPRCATSKTRESALWHEATMAARSGSHHMRQTLPGHASSGKRLPSRAGSLVVCTTGVAGRVSPGGNATAV
jgi:hypothetical protein